MMPKRREPVSLNTWPWVRSWCQSLVRDGEDARLDRTGVGEDARLNGTGEGDITRFEGTGVSDATRFEGTGREVESVEIGKENERRIAVSVE
jgi:hypothetical protein